MGRPLNTSRYFELWGSRAISVNMWTLFRGELYPLLMLLFIVTPSFARAKLQSFYEPKLTQVLSVNECWNGSDGGYYTEGPVFDKDGYLYFVTSYIDPRREGIVYKANVTQKTMDIFVRTKLGQYNGMPNGADANQDGILWIADLRHGLVKLTPDGNYKQIARTDSSGKALQGCNDVTIDNHGNLWLTAPAGKIAPVKYYDGWDGSSNGSIYSYVPVKDKLTKLDTGYAYSNGIVVQHSQDGTPSVLIVAEYFGLNLWAYNITGPGEISMTSKRLWGSAHGNGSYGYDGIDFDSEGNLLVTVYGDSTIHVYDPQGGTPISKIKLPFEQVTNLEFMPGSKEVYVTQNIPGCGVWMFEWVNKGMKKYRDLAV